MCCVNINCMGWVQNWVEKGTTKQLVLFHGHMSIPSAFTLDIVLGFFFFSDNLGYVWVYLLDLLVSQSWEWIGIMLEIRIHSELSTLQKWFGEEGGT